MRIISINDSGAPVSWWNRVVRAALKEHPINDRIYSLQLNAILSRYDAEFLLLGDTGLYDIVKFNTEEGYIRLLMEFGG